MMAETHLGNKAIPAQAPERKPIVIIPARGGSKGIPKKNICSLGGLPLIAYSIKVALAATSVGRVFLSTDDEEIAKIGVDLGAEVPFLRSAENATDEAAPGGAIVEMLEHYTNHEAFPVDYMVLYPTSPFRTPEMLNFLAAKLREGYRKAATVYPVELPCEVFRKAANGRFVSTRLMRPGKKMIRQCGSVAGYSKLGKESNNYYHILTSPIEQIDIDCFTDLKLAQLVIENKLYDFNVSALDKGI